MLPESEIIFNNYFTVIYLGLLFCTVLFFIEDNFKNLRHTTIKWYVTLFFGVCFLLLFGLRDFSVGIDNTIYIYLFETIYHPHKDKGFNLLTNILRDYTDVRGYLFSIAFIYMSVFLLFIKKWSPQNSIYLLFLFASFFIFKNMGMNVIRQGLACVFFLYGLSLQKEGKKILPILLFAIAFSFQATIIIPVGIWYVSRFINLKVSLAILILCSVLSIVNFGFDKLAGFLPFLSNLFENRFDVYINGTAGDIYRTGFRLNFFLFNWFFVGVFLLSFFYNKKLNLDPFHTKLLSTFIVLSGIFFMYFNLPYSDRIGLLSWIFIPMLILLFYEQPKVFPLRNRLLGLCLFFALYMIFLIFPSK